MPSSTSLDPSPLSPTQIRTLFGAVFRELTWGMPAASRELRGWRLKAAVIPDGPLRDDALTALRTKRGHADGAALFTILAPSRNRSLLRSLVAYETILDYLDNVSERHPSHDNGQRLHQALVDAIDIDQPVADYYRFHPWGDDGGYLTALVSTCRQGCRELPSYDAVRTVLRREALRARVLGLNHELDPDRRDNRLRAWALQEFRHETRLTWFELSGAASASLVIHVLLALAARPGVTNAEVRAAYEAHWPWIALATTMLDSYADWADDIASGNHSYVAHYPDVETMSVRIRASVANGMLAARGLPDGHRHAVIVASMVALFLSKRSAHTPEMRARTRTFARSGGSLVCLLLPILRLWRFGFGQRA